MFPVIAFKADPSYAWQTHVEAARDEQSQDCNCHNDERDFLPRSIRTLRFRPLQLHKSLSMLSEDYHLFFLLIFGDRKNSFDSMFHQLFSRFLNELLMISGPKIGELGVD